LVFAPPSVATQVFSPRDPLPHLAIVHRPAFTVTFVVAPDVDAIKALRMLLKFAGRHLGLRAIDVRQRAPGAREDERAWAQPGSKTMSAFSDRIRSQRKGFFKIADFENGKEVTHTISHLDEEMAMFGKTVDILNFVETGQQLQLNQTTSEWLLDTFGDEPQTWNGKRVTLYLAEYEYNKETKLGIRLKLPDTVAAVAGKVAASGDGAVPTRSRQADMDDEIPF
jgi:hypothetical protein